MKKTYATPVLISGGEVVQATLQSNTSGQPEAFAPLVYKPGIGGGMGFCL